MLAVFPGTFDPFTKGHLDILKRAAKMVENITIAVCESPSKHTLFTLEQRVEMVKQCIHNPKINVIGFSGLLPNLLKELNADFFTVPPEPILVESSLGPATVIAFKTTSKGFLFVTKEIISKACLTILIAKHFLPLFLP